MKGDCLLALNKDKIILWELLITNLYRRTIVQLSKEVFSPYTSINTNILFFEKSEYAWKVSTQDLEARNYNLDCKNPHKIEVNHRDPDELMGEYLEIDRQMRNAQDALKQELMQALGGG